MTDNITQRRNAGVNGEGRFLVAANKARGHRNLLMRILPCTCEAERQHANTQATWHLLWYLRSL